MSRQKLLRIAHFSSAHPAALAKSKVTQNADRRNTAGDGMTKTRSGGAAPLKATTLNFSDTATAFRDTPTRDLLRAFFVFHLFRSTSLVKHCTTIQNVSRKVLGEPLFNRLMKATVYGQFVGGEDHDNLKGVIGQLKSDGIFPVLDYAVENDIGDEEEVSLETRERGNQLQERPTEEDLSPEFSATTVKAGVMHKASARTHFYTGEEDCDRNMENFISCLRIAADCSSGRAAFVAIKVTALCRPTFLLELSEFLRRTRKRFEKYATIGSDQSGHSELRITEEALQSWLKEEGVDCSPQTVGNLLSSMDVNQSGSVNLLDWMEFFKPGHPHELLQSMNTSSRLCLSEGEQKQMANLLHRTHKIAKIASESGMRVMVDAEQTYYQRAISHIVVSELMPEYNHSTPTIYNTIQCYLKKAPEYVEEDLSLAKKHGFCYGAKLVRGAYMEQERDRAKEKKLDDPIHSTKEDTDRCYHNTVSRLMEEAKDGNVGFMVASHNTESAKHAVDEMDRLNIPREGGVVTFGQLYGMHDHITLTLGRAGYEAYKYLPYGPVVEVLPYLCRRANENSSMVKGAIEYRKFLGRELMSRLRKSTKVF